ncbi:MAG: hypothetical protein CL521_06225 [Actinobacteria bacterium]|nr:hypothetical protein [Actinomycetota bacterium]
MSTASNSESYYEQRLTQTQIRGDKEAKVKGKMDLKLEKLTVKSKDTKVKLKAKIKNELMSVITGLLPEEMHEHQDHQTYLEALYKRIGLQ